MAERRKPRKRSADAARETKRLTLLDLPPARASESDGSEPVLLLRRETRSTLLPTSDASGSDTSLESLARAARRASGPPSDRPSNRRRRDVPAPTAMHVPPVMPSVPPPPPPAYGAGLSTKTVTEDSVATLVAAPAPVLSPSSVAPPAFVAAPRQAFRTEPVPHPDFGNSVPPPIQLPSEPPRMRSRRRGMSWLPTLGVVVLSATVGAFASLTTWGVKSELSQASRGDGAGDETRVGAAAAMPTCAPSTTFSGERSTLASRADDSSRSEVTSDAPRIAFDALPLQSGRRRSVVAETVSLESSSSSSSESEPSSRHRAAAREHASRDRSHASKSSTPELPVAPSRAEINQAVTRAASAATSCDGGPNDGKVAITFAPSGAVQAVSLVKGFGDATVNGCVLRAFGRARVPAFSGDPVVVKKSIAW